MRPRLAPYLRTECSLTVTIALCILRSIYSREKSFRDNSSKVKAIKKDLRPKRMTEARCEKMSAKISLFPLRVSRVHTVSKYSISIKICHDNICTFY
jgi:hypothetical protein